MATNQKDYHGDPSECRSPHGWTLDTLAKHLVDKIADVESRAQERFALSKQAVDAALAAAEKAIGAAMAAAEKAVAKAEAAAEKRFEGMNEFRAAMKDQQNTFADRNQTDFRLGTVEARLEKVASRAEGEAKGKMEAWSAVVIVTTLILSAAGIVAAIIATRT